MRLGEKLCWRLAIVVDLRENGLSFEGIFYAIEVLQNGGVKAEMH